MKYNQQSLIQHYDSIAKTFHWLMATLFFGMFIVAYIMINMTDDSRFKLYDLHKATGLLLFALVALRLGWRLVTIQPRLPSSTPRWQRYAAKSNIILLYLLMFSMPITGFFTSTLGGHPITFYSLFTIQPLAHDEAASAFFSQAHEILSYLLLAAFSLHVFAALYHHYFLKDDVLTRMIPAKS